MKKFDNLSDESGNLPDIVRESVMLNRDYPELVSALKEANLAIAQALKSDNRFKLLGNISNDPMVCMYRINCDIHGFVGLATGAELGAKLQEHADQEGPHNMSTESYCLGGTC